MIAKPYPVKIFTPAPMLGYGYDIVDFWTTIMDERTRPEAIIMDSGSTDPGPYMLGSGRTLVSKHNYVHDLSPVLEACAEFGIKLLIGSAGGAGTNEQGDHAFQHDAAACFKSWRWHRRAVFESHAEIAA